MSQGDNPPYSAAADRNKEAIGDALASYFGNATSVLEVGSGTGQHAIYLCDRFKNLQWQPTEQLQHLESLSGAIKAAALPALLLPLPLAMEPSAKVGNTANSLSELKHSFAYSANTAHIMSIEEVATMFKVVASMLEVEGLFALYGPFKIDGHHTSEGNSEFDLMLKEQQSHMGIRDKGEIESLAKAAKLVLHDDIAMPANNRILLWRATS